MSSRWDNRPPCVLEQSGHGGTVILLLLLLALAGALSAVL
jgi:hypothetical protein